MPITFQVEKIKFNLKKKITIKLWIAKVLRLEKKQVGQINFLFTNDEEILKKNIQFLKHNTYTDIITFNYCKDKIINGDIIISIERVKENAEKFKSDFEEELKRVLIHGVLHLCGYNDKKTADTELMRKKENWALKQIS
jgi:probable rRNA maturation factor